MTAICAKIVIETIDSSLANFVRTIAIMPVRAAILAARGVAGIDAIRPRSHE